MKRWIESSKNKDDQDWITLNIEKCKKYKSCEKCIMHVEDNCMLKYPEEWHREVLED